MVITFVFRRCTIIYKCAGFIFEYNVSLHFTADPGSAGPSEIVIIKSDVFRLFFKRMFARIIN